MLNLVYHKSAQSRCYHPLHSALDLTRSMAARLLVFHPILKCFQSLKFSRPNKPQSCNISFIILNLFFRSSFILLQFWPRRFVSPMAFFLLLFLLFLLSLLLLFLHPKALFSCVSFNACLSSSA